MQRCPFVHLGHRGGQPGLERVAGHGGRVEHPSRIRRQCRQLGTKSGGDRGRHGFVSSVGGERRCRAHARELLEVERVAAGLRVDRRGRIADQLGRLRLAQGGELQREHAVLSLCAGERKAQLVGYLALARGHRKQHGRRGRPAHQRRQSVKRRRVGPVDVVQPDDQRADRRQSLEQIPQRPVRAMTIARRCSGRSIRESGQQRPKLQGLGKAQLRHPALTQFREVTVQRLGPEHIGQITLEFRGARTEHGCAVRCSGRRQMCNQPRLADAGLALDLDHGPSLLGQIAQRAGDRLALACPADHLRSSRVAHSPRFSRSRYRRLILRRPRSTVRWLHRCPGV